MSAIINASADTGTTKPHRRLRGEERDDDRQGRHHRRAVEQHVEADPGGPDVRACLVAACGRAHDGAQRDRHDDARADDREQGQRPVHPQPNRLLRSCCRAWLIARRGTDAASPFSRHHFPGSSVDCYPLPAAGKPPPPRTRTRPCIPIAFRYIVRVSVAHTALPFQKREQPMNNPFFEAGRPHVGGPFAGGPGPSDFGFGPHERHALREQRRQARREFREHVRGHDAGHDGPFGPGFGPVSARLRSGLRPRLRLRARLRARPARWTPRRSQPARPAR